jgi:hypothetical protein
LLVREWDRQSHRVMVLADGFAWNGQTNDNLSKVAFTITGTRWNGPRFFGLRANLLSLLFNNGDLAVRHVVAEGEGTANPESLALGRCDLVPDPLGGDQRSH